MPTKGSPIWRNGHPLTRSEWIAIGIAAVVGLPILAAGVGAVIEHFVP